VSARRGVDFAAYVRAVREGPCFVCRIVRGDAALLNPIVLDTGDAIAWVNPYQTLLGYTLVAPKEHREHVTGDFSVDEYVDLQRVVHRVGEAVRRAVPCERLYVLSLGSQQGNRHVHWHVVPLPPGLAYEEQQLEALRLENGVLDLPDEKLVSLGARIRAELEPR
jgi:diadenosine tetraphosphate (Ap4A) HIT family hydrolase